MIKLKVDNDKLVLFDENNSVSFTIDAAFFRVLKFNVEYIDKEGCIVSIEKKRQGEAYVVISNTWIRVPEHIAYEIHSRMLLLNKNLTFPQQNHSEIE